MEGVAFRGPHRSLTMSVLTILVLSLFAADCRAEVDCYGASIEISANSTDRAVQHRFYGYPAGFGRPVEANATAAARLVVAHPPEACGPVAKAPTPGSAALVRRGNCTFEAKAAALLDAGFNVMLVYQNVSDECVAMFGNSSTPEGRRAKDIMAVAVTLEAAEQLSSMVGSKDGAVVALRRPPPAGPELSAVLLASMAVFTIVAGSMWSGSDYTRRTKETQGGRRAGAGATAAAINDGGGTITATAAASFVLFSSAALLLMFFLFSRWLMLALLLFYAIAAWQSTALVLLSGLEAAAPASWTHATLIVPSIGRMAVLEAAAAAVAAAATAVWFICRHSHWAWMLQDLLSVCLMLSILRSVNLPSLRVAAILLPAAFCYDVWWVFLQPLVTGGQSVMVAVATAGGTAERMPMLLEVPQNGPGTNPAYSMLGLGDVVLPGLLVALCRRFDLASSFSLLKGYFLPCTIGYCAGLGATYAALAISLFGNQGQPALLYLVPCTLGLVSALAAWRGDLQRFWHLGERDEHVDEERGVETATLLGAQNEP
jgi:signal peptide peptidase-like 2B